MRELILHTKRVSLPLLKLMYLTYRVRKKRYKKGFTRTMTDEEVANVNKILQEMNLKTI